jgi:hypothetical protein
MDSPAFGMACEAKSWRVVLVLVTRPCMLSPMLTRPGPPCDANADRLWDAPRYCCFRHFCRLLTSDRVITCFLHFAPNPSTLMPPLERSGITRGERACHECRRMKVRCMREGETSCRRCQHMQMQCVIDPPSRRRKRANDSQGGASGSHVHGEEQNGQRPTPSIKRYAVRSRATRGPVLTSQDQYRDEWL